MNKREQYINTSNRRCVGVQAIRSLRWVDIDPSRNSTTAIDLLGDAGCAAAHFTRMKKREPIDDLTDLWVWIRRQSAKELLRAARLEMAAHAKAMTIVAAAVRPFNSFT